jgi:hypothetical protein
MSIRVKTIGKIITVGLFSLILPFLLCSCQNNKKEKSAIAIENRHKVLERRVDAIEQFLGLTTEQPVKHNRLNSLFLKEIKPLAKAAGRLESEDLAGSIAKALEDAAAGIDPYGNMELARIGVLKLAMLLLSDDLNQVIEKKPTALQSIARAKIYIRGLRPLLVEAAEFSGQQDLQPENVEQFLAQIDYSALATATIELAQQIRIVETATVRAFALCVLKEIKFYDSEKQNNPESARIRLIKAKAYYSVISEWYSNREGSRDIFIRMVLKEKMGTLDYPSVKDLLAKELPQLALDF